MGFGNNNENDNSQTNSNTNDNATYSNSYNSNSNNQNTNQQTKRQCYYCHGTGKCPTCNRTFRVHFWDENLEGWEDRNETRPGYVMCSDCHGSGRIYEATNMFTHKTDSRPCKVCHDGWVYCQECNSNGNGTNLGVCYHCRGTGYELY